MSPLVFQALCGAVWYKPWHTQRQCTRRAWTSSRAHRSSSQEGRSFKESAWHHFTIKKRLWHIQTLHIECWNVLNVNILNVEVFLLGYEIKMFSPGGATIQLSALLQWVFTYFLIFSYEMSLESSCFMGIQSFNMTVVSHAWLSVIKFSAFSSYVPG